MQPPCQTLGTPSLAYSLDAAAAWNGSLARSFSLFGVTCNEDANDDGDENQHARPASMQEKTEDVEDVGAVVATRQRDGLGSRTISGLEIWVLWQCFEVCLRHRE